MVKWDETEYQKDNIVAWKCNNWYERDDGLLELIEFGGQKIILRGKYKKLWTSINYEISMEMLWEELKTSIEFFEFNEMINQLMNMELLYKVDEQNTIDQIFG